MRANRATNKLKEEAEALFKLLNEAYRQANDGSTQTKKVKTKIQKELHTREDLIALTENYAKVNKVEQDWLQKKIDIAKMLKDIIYREKQTRKEDAENISKNNTTSLKDIMMQVENAKKDMDKYQNKNYEL